MNSENCMEVAQQRLSDARFRVEQKSALQYVPDDIQSALFLFMEAWLIARGARLAPSNMLKLRTGFMSKAPADLTKRVSRCLAQSEAIEIELFGDPDIPTKGDWSYDKLRTEALDCLEQCQNLIDAG